MKTVKFLCFLATSAVFQFCSAFLEPSHNIPVSDIRAKKYKGRPVNPHDADDKHKTDNHATTTAKYEKLGRFILSAISPR